MKDKLSSIGLKESVKKELDKRKIHPNQSYSEIIKQLLNGEE